MVSIAHGPEAPPPWRPPEGALAEMVKAKQEARLHAPSRRAAAADARRRAGAAWGRFSRALHAAPLPLIAEVKRRSPSAGDIAPGRDAVDQAVLYQRSGAAAVSVLADEHFFGGSPEDVRQVARSVSIPVLYKDIVVHPSQIELAAECGAAAVLLIVAALPPDAISERLAEAAALGLEGLVEVHTADELRIALTLPGVTLIGVNNRNLATLEVDLRTAERLVPEVPPGVLCVAESGYRTPEAAAAILRAGADAVLIGEALMRSVHPAAFAAALGSPERGGPEGGHARRGGPGRVDQDVRVHERG